MITKTHSFIISEILNGIIHGLTTVIPQSVQKGETVRQDGSLTQPEMGVLIGLTGDSHSQFVIDGEQDAFSNMATLLYGMSLEGDMLESFVGEVGNMVGGNMCTYASNQDISLDITHPTVLVGKTKLTGFKTALTMPVEIESIGTIRVSLLLETL